MISQQCSSHPIRTLLVANRSEIAIRVMPGMVVTLAVKAGQEVAKGDPLMSLEAMKMETMIWAERDAVVRHIHVKPGAVVAAKDLLLEFDI